MLSAAKCIAEIIVAKKIKNSGRVPWCYASKLLIEGNKNSGMSRRIISNYVVLLEKEKN
jgi:hypothetical protein